MPPANYDEARVGNYTLPDPLVFNDGKPVRTPKDWAKRRAEILTLFETNMFGRSPKPPKHPRFEVVDVDKNALGGKAVRTQISIYFSDKNNGPKKSLLLYVPSAAKKPVPIFLTLNFMGNQSVIDDPGIKLPIIGTGRRTNRISPPRVREERATNSRWRKLSHAAMPSRRFTIKRLSRISRALYWMAFGPCSPNQDKVSPFPTTGEQSGHGRMD